MNKSSNLVVRLSDIDHDDIDYVGKVAVNLGELIKLGVPIPKGFVITTNAYHQFLNSSDVPTNVVKEIFRAYKRLEKPLKDATVVVSPSFQQKQQTYIKGEANLIQKIREIWASWFDPRLDHPGIGTAIIVQKTIGGKQSGLMLTIDPTNNDKTKIIIYEGNDSKNRYEVSKTNLKLVSKVISSGKKQMFTDKQIVYLATLGKKLQEYYYFPQELYFVIEKNNIYFTKIKPITQLLTEKFEIQNYLNNPIARNVGRLLFRGTPISPGIATGPVRLIKSKKEIDKVVPGEILIVSRLSARFALKVMRSKAIIIIDDKKHRFYDIQRSFRYFNKPVVLSEVNLAKIFKDRNVITVDGTNGKVHKGSMW